MRDEERFLLVVAQPPGGGYRKRKVPAEGRNSLLGLIRGALLPHTISGAIPAGLIRLIEIPSHIL